MSCGAEQQRHPTCTENALVTVVATRTAETAATSTATAAATIFLRAGFVDVERTAVEVRTIQCRDCRIALSVVAHFDEAKAAGLTRIAIRYDADAIHGPVGLKHPTYGIFGCAEA